MIPLELEVDDEIKVFNIPQNWDDISIGVYEALAKVDKTKDDYSMSLDILCAISGMDFETVEMIPVDSMPLITEHLEFIKTEIENKNIDFITVGGEDYYLKKDFDKLNNGEVISLEMLNSKYENNLEAAMADMLCVFLRKKKENGNLETFKSSFMERSDMFRKEVMISDVYHLFVFFLNGKD